VKNTKENDKSCFFCRWNKADSDCSQIEVCKNFEPWPLDVIVENVDCISEDDLG
jgi:hypothetical protein